MKQIAGLVWRTERPVHDVVRRSRKFWLLGYEWNLSLQLSDVLFHGLCYTIHLNKLDYHKYLATPLTVTLYISSTGTDCGSSLYQITRCISTGQNVWRRDAKSADAVLGSEVRRGKWTITCIFQSNHPLMLHVGKNATELSSFQDKCVQAFSDIPPDLESLSGDFRRLLKDDTFTDVKLRCGDRTISAHMSILAARSDVLTAMFRSKMAESETGTVDVTDVDSEVLDLFLQYVYSGKIPDLSEDTASSLYEAGDKYSIQSLKKACSDWMVRNLTAENCLGYLVVAESHNDEEFKERVADFAAKNLESMKRDYWFQFNKDYPCLANSVYQRRLASAIEQQV